MKNYYLLICLVVVALSCKRDVCDCSAEVSEAVAKYEHYEIASSGRFIFEGLQVFDLDLGNKQYLKDIVGGGRLVIRFSELNCQDCVNSMAEMIRKFFDVKKDRILILGSYQSNRTFQLYLNKLGLENYEAYNIAEGALNDYIDHDNVPYAFLLNNDMRIDNLLIPDFRLAKVTQDYFEIIANRF